MTKRDIFRITLSTAFTMWLTVFVMPLTVENLLTSLASCILGEILFLMLRKEWCKRRAIVETADKTDIGAFTVFVVTHQEIAEHPTSMQPALRILKNKGAPIEGTFHLRVLPGYEIREYNDDANCLIKYVFKKVS